MSNSTDPQPYASPVAETPAENPDSQGQPVKLTYAAFFVASLPTLLIYAVAVVVKFPIFGHSLLQIFFTVAVILNLVVYHLKLHLLVKIILMPLFSILAFLLWLAIEVFYLGP